MILYSLSFYALHSVTVAASDRDDTFAGFSHFGPCVDIIAPVSNISYGKKSTSAILYTQGVDITSTWLNNGTWKIQGTYILH